MAGRDGRPRAWVREGLRRSGLLPVAHQVRDLWRSAAYIGKGAPPDDDGLPVPTPDLIFLVAGTPDTGWFLDGGRRAADSIRSALARHGVDVQTLRSILDFGCGCGRVVRHWRGLEAQVHGSDMNRRLVRWCRRHLRFAMFETNGPRPPLPYRDGQFDLVYALSVFTHLPADLQRPWIEELRRVTAPDGYVLLSLHGERYLPDLSAEERRRFEEGHLVVRGADTPGRNTCGAYHPPAYVRDVLAEGFRLVDHLPEGAAGNPYQDLVLLQRSAG